MIKYVLFFKIQISFTLLHKDKEQWQCNKLLSAAKFCHLFVFIKILKSENTKQK